MYVFLVRYQEYLSVYDINKLKFVSIEEKICIFTW